jgi:hypothetical protein
VLQIATVVVEFVFKFIAVDRFATSSVEVLVREQQAKERGEIVKENRGRQAWKFYRKVSALAHEIWDDAVENRALEVKGLATASSASFPSAELAKVLCGLRDDVGSEFHGNTTSILAVTSIGQKARKRWPNS